MGNGQGATSTVNTTLGVASASTSLIPGIGPIAGMAIGMLPQVASWIFGKDKFDWNDWKAKQAQGINTIFDKSIANATGQANKSFNATIGQTTNAQGMASGVAGMSGAGRINAQTYANVAENRDNAVTGITNGLEQNRASMLSAVEREAAQGSMQEDFNAPTGIDYLKSIVEQFQTSVMQEGVGALIGGIGKAGNWMGNLFRSGAINSTPKNVAQMPNRSPLESFNAPDTTNPVASVSPITSDGGNIYGQSAIFNPAMGKFNWLNKPILGKLKNYNIGG